MNRREAIATVAASLGALAALPTRSSSQDIDPRLRARPRAPDRRLEPGSHNLGLERERDGLLHIPPAAAAGTAVPALLMLHGAGGSAEPIRRWFPLADELGIVMIVPESRGGTWDAIHTGFGPDVRYIDRALEFSFRRAPVDPQRLAIGGFSDGASYALALGLANGELFPRITAFSPGFIPAARRNGRPRIFISHGTADQILDIDRASRRIVPSLREAGYDLRYEEFEGRHTVPEEIARTALTWLIDG